MSAMPELVVVRGAPDEESLAALVTVLLGYAASGASAASAPPAARPPWTGEPWVPGSGAWRRSGLPH
ncbi:acyl-CoA carboxylase epsilon subunit [Amycolatopsis sp. cmx-4-68]|uniref:acyl-CoA carboxylase epsilon subunit n=1 Tax=Amycolatopsis sp. cmx-4-68 TaxID=2790938 RepID=UPI00397D2F5A